MADAVTAALQRVPTLSELAHERFSNDPALAWRAAHAAPGPGIFRMPNGDGLIATAHQTLTDLMGHPSLGAQIRGQRRAGSGGAGALSEMDLNSPFFMDEPVHAPMALAVFRPMSQSRAAELSAALTEIAEGAVERMLAVGGSVDLVADYALTIAREFWQRFLGLSDAAIAVTEECSAAIVPMLKFQTTPREIAEANDAAERLSDVLEEHYKQIRGSNEQTLFHALESAVESCHFPGAPPSAAAVIAAITFDGFHSVAGATANALYVCLQNPDQLAMARNDPELINGAWREAMRIAPSFVGLHRGALEDIEYGGTLIPRGTNVVMAWGAANQDPRVFDEPARFDIRRDNKKILSFGGGPRICKGRYLAMLEGETALRVLLKKTREIEPLRGSADWGQPGLMRAVRALPARLTGR